MQQYDVEAPAWLPALNQWVHKLGIWRALALLVGAVWLMAVGISQLAITMLGEGNRLIATLAASTCAISITSVFGYLFLSLVQHLDKAHKNMTRHATLDSLTGTFNRRYFLELVEREWSRAKRYEMSCALLLMDVDHFKQVNDRFGHLCGDQLLREIAEVSSETLRQPDVLARFGGEEFIVFLPHTDPLGALDVAERIRERIEALDFSWRGELVPVSASLGVAALHAEHITLDHLISDADEALYVAKSAGRNCVRAGAGLLPGRSSVTSG
ncbi:GGDEF domain-containing protein [Paucibacter sp. PLA-PC-4]|uniref:GGDEF domain-containing protein n=1 Tax=Paucibacter sp. PLA-PC-4 TaxID=2993655 RepID=UPI002248A288|nr:GGDEF domain-containing protein [Paucibacter sp. PLA-PC-4]MCX2863143.1 GGDEF domain-containing protein [Paucibacter sp. PLA-PC-4]